jgi:large subunit ribosomal protein L4
MDLSPELIALISKLLRFPSKFNHDLAMSLNVILLDNKFTPVEAFNSLNDYEVRHQLLAQVVRSEMMNLRSGNAHTKTRAEVRGGGKKPWRQKGTGRARHGSIRSPIWVGGGLTFGPRSDRNWALKINKTSRIAALKSILKDRLHHQAVFQFPVKYEFPKTREAVELLGKLSTKTGHKNNSVLVVYTTEEKENLRGFANSGANLINAHNLKIFKLAQSKNLVLTPKSLEVLQERVS